MRNSLARLIAAARLAVTLGVLPALLVSSCGRRAPQTSSDVVAVRVPALPTGALDAAWAKAPVCTVPLILQDLVEPRLLKASTPAVNVQALTDGARLVFRLAWTDSTQNDLPGAARFSDACAVQLPRQVTADLPAPQMGESGRTVDITYWSSAWQARVDGRKDNINELYPGAAVGHYPFDAPSLPAGSPEQVAMSLRYAPAKHRGNWMAGDGVHAVQDLIAEGPGTLTPVPDGTSTGRGGRTAGGWTVVLARDLPAAARPAGRTQVAFAIWDGAHQEVGARKMRSGWIPLQIGGER